MAIRVLGPLDTGTEQTLSPRERVVLAALIVRAGRTVAPGDLAEACWGEDPPRTWPQQVKTCVARIRAGLGSAAVVTRGSEYTLGIDPATIDAFEFERLVSSARQHALHDEHDRAVDAYRRALDLWRGEPYVDLVDWAPAAVEAERLIEIRDSAQEELLEARLAEGEHRAVIADAERLVRAAPLREDRWAILAIANYRAGRQAEALATVRAARTRLADELGIDVGQRLRELEASMLQQDPTLTLVKTLHRVSDACPYRGLAAFSVADVDEYFGREGDVEALLQRVRPGTLTAVVGASGSGKSSLVFAGLLPHASEGRRVAVVTAGREAATRLRARLEQRGAVDLVVVDQSEAVFQLTEGEQEELCALVASVLERGSAVVFTLRSDFLDHATGLPHIGTRIGRGVYAIGPLTLEGLREAIECPATRAGLRLEPGLVEVIVRDADDRRGTLPHVSHALVETWIRREGATLTVAGYEASGGIVGAIAQSAESLYRSLEPEAAEACRSLMLRLVHRGADGTSVRRTAQLAPLIADPARRRVLDRLVGARLLATDGDEVTVAHEAVATAWPRLDGWLEEDAEGARLVSAVATAAELWNGSGRREEDLLRGARLQAALDWRDETRPDLTAVERELLDASAEREQDEVRELGERAAREKRNNRRLRWAVGGAGVLLVAAVVGGSLAVVRGGEAQVAAENASVEALVATSLSLIDNDREVAALLAAEAYRRWPDDPRTRSALWGVVTNSGGVVAVHHGESASVPWLDVIPGTGTAVRASVAPTDPTASVIDIVDLATGDSLRALDTRLPLAEGASERSVAVSPDGTMAAISVFVPPDPQTGAGCCGTQLSVIDLATGRSGPPIDIVPTVLTTPATWDAQGRTLFVADTNSAELLAIDVTSGTIRASSGWAPSSESPMDDVQFYAPPAVIDDQLVAVGAGREIRLYDTTTLALVRRIALEDDRSTEGLITDGRGGLVAAGWDGSARIAPDGTIVWRQHVNGTVSCVSVYLASPDTIACGSYGGVSILDLDTGEPVGPAAPLQYNRKAFFDSIDDQSLIAFPTVPAVWLRWRIDGGGAGADVVAKGRELLEGPEAGSPLVVTQPSGGGPMQLWDIDRDVPVGEESARIVPLGSGVVARFTEREPGPLFARYERQWGRPTLERVATGEEIPLRIRDLPDSVNVYPGGWAMPAFAAWPGGVVAFDPSTGEALGPIMTIPEGFTDVKSVSETPDGTRVVLNWWSTKRAVYETGVFEIATGALIARGLFGLEGSLALDDDRVIGVAEDYARAYDIRTLEPIAALARAAGGGNRIGVSGDGRTLLNVGYNNTLTLYDVAGNIALASPVDGTADATRIAGGFLTSDGERLIEALPNGIRVWDLRTRQQSGSACALAGRELTPDEWSTYFPGEAQVATCAALGSAAGD
ncbi:BTAD domain-containing putative transcriptional regulator [Microbacterium sp. NPDC056044]|uniref:nSTAND1 domain-containing NTPase n=1 Tax=Microbacterium sp. NPDC056044 TaxID=3345690 RepID=UPI0035DF726D